MLRIRCSVDVSAIPHAGKGLFADQPVAKGTIIESPIDIRHVYTREQLLALPPDSPEFMTSTRWYHDCYVTDPHYSDTYYINHSFEPNCLWHLGFIFALNDIPAGAEITLDYRVLMDADPELGFRDSATGRLIHGFTFEEKMVFNATQLLTLFQSLGGTNAVSRVTDAAAA